MEDEGIGLVLARATELRSKINNCIHRTTRAAHAPPNGPVPTQQPDGNEEVNGATDKDNEEEEEEAERLLNICDAMEALENQLSSLQVTLEACFDIRVLILILRDFFSRMILHGLFFVYMHFTFCFAKLNYLLLFFQMQRKVFRTITLGNIYYRFCPVVRNYGL